jgi:hypothetical protein
MTLENIAPGVWSARRPLRFLGLEVGTRMTVLRLADGSLALHSPIPLDVDLDGQGDLGAAIDALGSVSLLIAPNRFHHLFLEAASRRYPKARVLGVPGLEKKQPGVRFDALVDEPGDADRDLAWAPVRGVAALLPTGVADFREVAYLHRPSGTLVVTDAAYHFGPSDPLETRIGARLIGAYGRLTPSLLERWGSRDKASVEASIKRLLEWDFDRVVPAHGAVVETGGHDAFRSGYERLLRRPLSRDADAPSQGQDPPS